MSVEVALGTPLAEALNVAIQGKIAELGWANPGTEGAAMSEYFVLMLANGKTESDIAGEIAGDLLGLGPDDQTAPAFAKWLFEQIGVLRAQLGTGAAPSSEAADGQKDEPMDGSADTNMDSAPDAPAAGLNAYVSPRVSLLFVLFFFDTDRWQTYWAQGDAQRKHARWPREAYDGTDQPCPGPVTRLGPPPGPRPIRERENREGAAIRAKDGRG